MTQKGKRGRHADFEAFEVSFFAPYLFNDFDRLRQGCGATAPALLTGVPPELIAKQNGRRHYSDHFMTSFLKKRGFRVLKLTPLSVCGAKSPIGTRHVILLSQLFRRLEATWTVAHWNSCYHNFEMYELSSLSFLNKPIVSAYLVSHPNWRIEPVDEPGAAKLTKATGPRLKIDQLRKDAAFTTISKWT